MPVKAADLNSLDAGTVIETDLAIVGGGAAGLCLAREFFGSAIRVLVIESGSLQERPDLAALNRVCSIGEPRNAAQLRRRIAYHSAICKSWSQDVQPFGLRCRVLGGSTHAWVGKSAAFDTTDFAPRPWVPNSGWPFGRETLDPYIERAARHLNLGPNCYDERLWDELGLPPPDPALDGELLRSYFWQFARSRIDTLDILRLGPDFLRGDAPNVQVLMNATVIRIDTDDSGRCLESLEIATLDGRRCNVKARAAVLAASGIENPRLLLVSNRIQRNGLGNQHDLVGRHLMDHPCARIGRFEARDSAAVMRRFGFFGLRHAGRAHMYLHGLALSPDYQRREGLLNCAAYMMEERAPDDPFDALKRLIRGESGNRISDLIAVASSPSLVAKGLGIRLFRSDAVPDVIRTAVANAILIWNPNFAAREFQSRGIPHKLTGVAIEAVTEQIPDPLSRITLSDQVDALGIPLARVDWKVDTLAIRSVTALGKLIETEFKRVGLPVPLLESWVSDCRAEDTNFIDIGHPAGATRMSDSARRGVVDSNCQVHGVAGLYVAGASVFPTSGHANPTLMIVALAVRLADRIKAELHASAGPVERAFDRSAGPWQQIHTPSEVGHGSGQAPVG